MVSMWPQAPVTTPADCGTFTVDTACTFLRGQFIQLCSFLMENKYFQQVCILYIFVVYKKQSERFYSGISNKGHSELKNTSL